MGKKKGARKKKATPEELIEDDDEAIDVNDDDYYYDEVDKFHSNKNAELEKNLELDSDDSDIDDEEEVLGIGDESSELATSDDGDDDDDEDGDDADDEDIDLGIPSSKAWGKKKSVFYGAETLDGLQGVERDQVQDAEEEEALKIQQRLADEIDPHQLNFFQTTAELGEAKKASGEVEEVRTDVSSLSLQAQWKLLHKEAPELRDLVADFKERAGELNSELTPLMKLVATGKIKDAGAEYVRARHDLYSLYLLHITFYLALKSRRVPITNHPVVARLVKYRTLINKLSPVDVRLAGEIRQLLEYKQLPLSSDISDSDDDDDVTRTEMEMMDRSLMQQRGKSRAGKTSGVKSMMEQSEEQPLMRDGDASEADDGDADDRRAINYDMNKNKGSTGRGGKKRKLDRNPRVKHREKFRKAKIRRKGAVREFRPEINKYSGEASGIRAGVVRGVRIR